MYEYKTVSKLFLNSFSRNKSLWMWNVLAVLSNHSRCQLFARQASAGGEAMTCADTGCDWLKQLKRFTAVW